MSFNPFKKKSLWDDITGAVSGAANAVGGFADKVIPGDQSSWHAQDQQSAPAPQQSNPILTRSQPQVVATFQQPQQQSVASFQHPQTQPNNPITVADTPDAQPSITDPNALQVQTQPAQPKLAVATAQPRQTIHVAQPPINTPAVEQGLQQGKSWENIAKETGSDLTAVQQYSQKTRPHYGMQTDNYLNVNNKTGDTAVNNTTAADLGTTFDKMSADDKTRYHESLKQLALNGNFAAQNTLDTLNKQGKFKFHWGDLGKNIVSGMEQGAGNVADVAVMGGAVVGNIGDRITGVSDEQQAKNLQGYENIRNWIKDQKTVNGNSFNAHEDYAPTGNGIRDFTTAAGRGLETGVDATMFMNPLTNAGKTAAVDGVKLTGANLVKDIATRGAVQGLTDATGAGLSTYGDTGDITKALETAGTTGATTFATQGLLEGAGHGLGHLHSSSKGVTNSVVDAITKETNPAVLAQALNIPENIATGLANQTDHAAVAETLKQLAVDPNIQLTPEMRQRLQDEGITDVTVDPNLQYNAAYDRNNGISFKDPSQVTPDNVYHEVGHQIYNTKLTPEEKAAFANVHGDAWQQAQTRAGYTPDDMASEDFSNFTRLALEGKINEVPAEVRGIVAKYAQVAENNVPASLSTKATNSLENAPEGIKPGGLERAKQEIDNGTAQPIKTRVLPDGSIVIEDGRHRLQAAKEMGMTEFPTEDVSHLYANELDNAPKASNNLGLDTTDPRARFANRSSASPAEEIANRFGGTAADVQRNIDRYGEEATRNMYAQKHDSPSINNLDAVVSAELKKTAKVKVTNAAPTASTMSPEEEASLLASAPEQYNGVDPRTVTQNAPETAPTPDIADIPTAKATNDNVNIDTPFPEVKVTDGELGSMASSFYDANQGNNSIKFRDLKQLGTNIKNEIDRSFEALGTTFEDVAREVADAKDHGMSLEQVGLSPQEMDVWNKVQAEMDYVRRRASLGSREVGTGDQGNMYVPSERPGQYADHASLFEGFRDVKPGNEFKNTGAIPIDERNFGSDIVGNYITRYGDTKLLQEDRIARAVEKNNPGLPQETISNATQKIVDLQNRVNSLQTKITVGGLGKKVTVSDGEHVDFANELSTVGKDLGHKQIEVTAAPHGLTNGDKINSVQVNNQPLGDVIGLNQHRDAGAFASSQVKAAAGDREALTNAVAERLRNAYNLPADDAQYLVDRVGRIAHDVPDDVVQGVVANTYTSAAKQQLMEQLQNLDIKNPTLRRNVSELANQIVREGSVEQKLSAKVVSTAMTTTNAIFRKFNVSSALNELSDMNSFISSFGGDIKLAPDFGTLKEFNLGEPDAAIAPYLKQAEAGSSFKDIASKINNATNLYHFVETYKAAVVATSSRELNISRGLTGDALTARVLKDYRDLALPVDAFTKTFLDNYPLYTQYMTWGVRNLAKEGKLATGKIDAGNLQDMTQGQRIARNLYANLPAKTVFWLSSNALKGTAILTAFGLTDFTGMTNGDYSGIQEEDKSAVDKVSQYTGASTTLSILGSIYQAYEKEQLKNSDKYQNASYNPYANANFASDATNVFKPQVVKNVGGATEMMKQGYSANKSGNVQYEAPTDAYNVVKAFVFGKGQTANARDYTGNKNVIDRVSEGQNPVSAVTNMAKEQLNSQDRNYQRPLNDKYSEAYKGLADGARTAMLQGGRQYNAYLDTFKKDHPTEYNTYIATLDGNHVSPEFWKGISEDTKGGSDMTTFNMLADRKKQAAKDLGTPYDPVYDLSGDQAKSVLQLKSTATGDDLALRNTLNKEGWYKDFKKKTSDYYAANPSTGGDSNFPETQRVKDWNGLNDKLNSYYYDPTATEKPAWATTFPMVYEQKAINDKYGFDSQQSKDFFKANADAYQAQKEGFDKEQLGVINEMRKIEGYPEMGWEAYKQATNVASTSTTAKKAYSGYSSGSGGQNIHGSYGSQMGTGLKQVSSDAKTVKVLSRTQAKPKAIKVTRGGKI